MKIVLAQINSSVGNFGKNLERIKQIISEHHTADMIVFPELCMTGYPLEDLVDDPDFRVMAQRYHELLIEYSKYHCVAIVYGNIRVEDGKLYNSLYLIDCGQIKAIVDKTALPNYGVFDEKRNFKRGRSNKVVEFKGKKIGFLICEDAWKSSLHLKHKEDGADLIISINSSPFDISKHKKRERVARKIVKATQVPFVYVNTVGAQDEIVFDGGSFIMQEDGAYSVPPLFWEEKGFATNFLNPLSPIEHIYNAIILSIRDYFTKNGVSKALIGISGGIDSALVAVLAADALGPENLTLVRLPSQYSSDHSLSDAKELSDNLGVKSKTVHIEEFCEKILTELAPMFVKSSDTLAEENIQSRIRGLIMMTLSNKNGGFVLSTGNKSEYACGYATLYGDMCGAYAPLKDVYKTTVYELAKWRNESIPKLSIFRHVNLIPLNSISKAPSAELKPDQFDQDSLPPYEILDEILYLCIEKNMPLEAIVQKGFDKGIVLEVLKMLRQSEFKRRQAAIGPKISTRNLSRERRYPIINKFDAKYVA